METIRTSKELKMANIKWIKVKYWLYEQIDDEANRNSHGILVDTINGAVMLDNEYACVAYNDIIKETEKAYLIEFTESSKSGRPLSDSYKRWVPKSQVVLQ